jgi:catechol 2,3-dioxygenase-like lactoylglutathione lyase family enzyme
MRESHCKLEHANIGVRDFDEAVRFLTTAFPEFEIRHDARSDEENPWMHIGTDSMYIALMKAADGDSRANYTGPGVNHLGFVVDDADDLKQRLLAAGYQEGFIADPHPHRKRIYFHDADGLEWEFVQYFSDDPDERNDYSS